MTVLSFGASCVTSTPLSLAVFTAESKSECSTFTSSVVGLFCPISRLLRLKLELVVSIFLPEVCPWSAVVIELSTISALTFSWSIRDTPPIPKEKAAMAVKTQCLPALYIL